MNKRDLILNALMELLAEDKGATCSVSDIAKKAGIGKGSIYYYFSSKEEIFDALIDHIYSDKIRKCKDIVDSSKGNAIEKLELFLNSYKSSLLFSSIDDYLHQPQNAAIHQKSLAMILTSISPIISGIIRQGNEEKVFKCQKPEETADIFLSVICFLFDHGIFPWTMDKILCHLEVLVSMLELELQTPKGTLNFLCKF